jgi:hypothetical protein
MEGMVAEGKYIYCIICNDDDAVEFGPIGIGERGDRVYTIRFQDITAVVSDSPIKKYTASRRNFISHEHVIEEVMKCYTVLPVRFSTIAEDEHAIKKILENERDKFRNLLHVMQGKKELGLKAVFKEDVIYKDILEKHEEIRVLKEKAASLPSNQIYYQLIEIGTLVESALQAEKEIYHKEFLDTLSPLAVEVKINDPYGERMIVNAAFLVEQKREPEFDQRVNDFSDKYGDKIIFKYVGTVPPFNFVNLVIETGGY